MPSISAEELLVRLKKGKPVPALLLLGEEAYLRDACRAQLIDAYVPEAARTWAVSRYSAERGEIQSPSIRHRLFPCFHHNRLFFWKKRKPSRNLPKRSAKKPSSSWKPISTTPHLSLCWSSKPRTSISACASAKSLRKNLSPLPSASAAIPISAMLPRSLLPAPSPAKKASPLKPAPPKISPNPWPPTSNALKPKSKNSPPMRATAKPSFATTSP